MTAPGRRRAGTTRVGPGTAPGDAPRRHRLARGLHGRAVPIADAVLRARLALIVAATAGHRPHGTAPAPSDRPAAGSAGLVRHLLGVPLPLHLATLERLGCLAATVGQLARLTMPSGC